MKYKVSKDEKEYFERHGIEGCLVFMFDNIKRKNVRKFFVVDRIESYKKCKDSIEFDFNKNKNANLLTKLHDRQIKYFPDKSIYDVFRYSVYFRNQFPS